MKRAVRTYGRFALAIVFLAALGLTIGAYIVVQQRLPNPFAEYRKLRAEFTSSAGLTPGLGQPVNVAGVKVGTVMSVDLRDGRAIVNMQIEPDKLPRVYENASAVLVPNTPLKDMLVEILPGNPPARVASDDFVIPVGRTDSPIDWDDVTSALDADTRRYFEILVGGLAQGGEGRGDDLNEIFKALGPTTEQVATLMAAVRGRRRELSRLVHNLGILGRAVGTKDKELMRLIGSTDEALETFALEEAALREVVRKTPAALARARESLPTLTRFANTFVDTVDTIEPTLRRAPAALRAADPLVRESIPILRDDLRPLTRELVPLVTDLRPAIRDLNAVTPSLTSAFRVLNYVVNTLAYNPPGDEEGYLFWLAWFTHNSASFLSTEDAHGALWRGLALVNCSGFGTEPAFASLVALVVGATGCDGQSPSTAAKRVDRPVQRTKSERRVGAGEPAGTAGRVAPATEQTVDHAGRLVDQALAPVADLVGELTVGHRGGEGGSR